MQLPIALIHRFKNENGLDLQRLTQLSVSHRERLRSSIATDCQLWHRQFCSLKVMRFSLIGASSHFNLFFDGHQILVKLGRSDHRGFRVRPTNAEAIDFVDLSESND